MKKLLSVVLALTLCFALFTGCKKAPEVPPQPQHIALPLPPAIDINNINDCTAEVSLEKGDAFVDDTGKMQMKLTIYGYDLYDMVDIAALKEGDAILIGESELIITEIERLDTGLVRINGGEEKGGYDLGTNDNTVYYEIGMNDVKSYYQVCEVTLPVSTEFVYYDKSDLDSDPKEYYPGDFLTDDANIEYNFTPHNTSVVISDGVIVEMTKHYTP